MSDINTKMAELTVTRVAVIDASFRNIDRQLFEVEFAALRLETFALAWAHSFSDDSRVMAQATLMHEYLSRNERLDIWAAMLDYNQAIARSTQKALPADERRRSATASSQNLQRVQLFDKMVLAGVQPEVAGHAVNLNFTQESWAKGYAQGLLTYSLLRRTGLLSNDGDPVLTADATAALAGTIGGMYRDVKERIARVEIEPPALRP